MTEEGKTSGKDKESVPGSGNYKLISLRLTKNKGKQSNPLKRYGKFRPEQAGIRGL